jgi:ATP-dependent DNA helicase MPH1
MKTAPVYPSEEIYQAAPLEEVFLDESSTKDLKRRYQKVYDGEDAIVAPPRYDRDPPRQRVLRKSRHFRKPGRVTQRFVETLQRMHAMDERPMEELRPEIPDSDCDSDFESAVVVSDATNAGGALVVPDDMWASDDPASQRSLTLPGRVAPKPKPRGARKAKGKASTPVIPQPQAATIAAMVVPDDMWASDDPGSQPNLMPPPKVMPKQKPKVGRKSKERVTTTAAPASNAAKIPARSRQNEPHTTPARRPQARKGTKTPTFRMSEQVEEGASSSPPPTDPRMRLASQAVDLGSQDTEGEEDIDDTEAYLLDSDLRDFIAGDNEHVDVPESSLPSLVLGNVGAGTQAVVRGAKAKRPRRMEKLFTSDPTDVDVVMSSDSDEDGPLQSHTNRKLTRKTTYAVDSASETEVEEDGEDGPALPSRKRVRRVIDEDDEDD